MYVPRLAPKVRSFVDDTRGSAAKAGQRAVGLVAALIMGGITAAFALPIGFGFLSHGAEANWSSGGSALWGIFDVVAILALFVFVTAYALEVAD